MWSVAIVTGLLSGYHHKVVLHTFTVERIYTQVYSKAMAVLGRGEHGDITKTQFYGSDVTTLMLIRMSSAFHQHESEVQPKYQFPCECMSTFPPLPQVSLSYSPALCFFWSSAAFYSMRRLLFDLLWHYRELMTRRRSPGD